MKYKYHVSYVYDFANKVHWGAGVFNFDSKMTEKKLDKLHTHLKSSHNTDVAIVSFNLLEPEPEVRDESEEIITCML